MGIKPGSRMTSRGRGRKAEKIHKPRRESSRQERGRLLSRHGGEASSGLERPGKVGSEGLSCGERSVMEGAVDEGADV